MYVLMDREYVGIGSGSRRLQKVTISQDNDNKPLSNKLTVFSQTIIEAMWAIWTEHNENKLLLS